MKKTFIHTFSNGNSCKLTMDFRGVSPRVDAEWSRKVEEEWPDIEEEYLHWRDITFNTFMDGLTFSEKLRVAEMANQ